MTSWSDFETAAPALAAEVRRRLDAYTHKTLATLRRDGGPRISGTEARFADGELWIGSMSGSLKARDLQRDPRFALHSGSGEPPDWPGDAKVAGFAEEVNAQAGSSHQFRLDLREASTVTVADSRDHLVIELWTAEGGARTIKRV